MKPTTPEPRINIPERKTTDLCGHEHRGARCVRERDHVGQHECPFWKGSQYLSWTSDERG
jgi:hypothetical protein